MKLIITLMFALSSTGCVFQTVEMHEIKNSEAICNSVGANLARISASLDAGYFVECTDGRIFYKYDVNKFIRSKK